MINDSWFDDSAHHKRLFYLKFHYCSETGKERIQYTEVEKLLEYDRDWERMEGNKIEWNRKENRKEYNII